MFEFARSQFLNPLDESYLNTETDPTMNVYMGFIGVLSEPVEPARARDYLMRALDPRFREVALPARFPFIPARWMPDASFDPDRHFRVLETDPEASLDDLMPRLSESYTRKLDPAHPLWEVTFVPRLQGSRSALLFKVQHCFIDGTGLAMMLMRAGTLPDHELVERPPSDPPAFGALDALRLRGAKAWDSARFVGETLARAATQPEERRSMARQLRSGAAYASHVVRGPRAGRLPRRAERTLLVRCLASVEEAKQRAKDGGGTVNDLFLLLASNVTHRYHRKIGVPLDHVTAVMPINERGENALQNLASEQRSAEVRIPFAPERGGDLADVKRLSAAAKRLDSTPISPFVGRLLGLLPRPVRAWYDDRALQVADIVASNVIVPLLRFAGSQLSELYALGPAMGNVAFFTLAAYEGSINLTVTLDRGQVADLPAFESILDDEIAALFPRP